MTDSNIINVDIISLIISDVFSANMAQDAVNKYTEYNPINESPWICPPEFFNKKRNVAKCLKLDIHRKDNIIKKQPFIVTVPKRSLFYKYDASVL